VLVGQAFRLRIAVNVVFPDGDIENVFDQVPLRVRICGCRGVGFRHNITALRSLAVGGHVYLVVACVGSQRGVAENPDMFRLRAIGVGKRQAHALPCRSGE
jgi:hypothetical protein